MIKLIPSVTPRWFRLNPLVLLSALAIAGAPPLAAGTLFQEDFESPNISGYEQGVTPPDRWVRATSGYGSGDHGMTDKDSGDFTATDPNTQAYSCSYTNSGITTAEGVMGPPLAVGGAYEVSFAVVRNNRTAGRAYAVRLIAFADGAARNDCISTPAGSTVVASATGNAPDNGSFATVSFTYTPTAAAPLGKDLGIRFVGASNSAIIDPRRRDLPSSNSGLPPGMSPIIEKPPSIPVYCMTP